MLDTVKFLSSMWCYPDDPGETPQKSEMNVLLLANAIEALTQFNVQYQGEREGLTLFLERPYISGAGPEVAQNVMRMFVELAERKADELDTMLVLSSDYRNHIPSGFTWTKYAVYISKSKAGAQYLDSLGGQAAVSAEGSYKSNTFLVREYGAPAAA